MTPESRDKRVMNKQTKIEHNDQNLLKVIFACLALALMVLIGVVVFIQLNDEDGYVPPEVAEFGEKYPEAAGYVKNFSKCVGKEFDMDVSDEMAERRIPLFIQWDKRWGYREYGDDYIGVSGCGPTCLAMVICGLKNDSGINPYKISEYSKKQGYYVENVGTSWELMTTGANSYGLSAVVGKIDRDYILSNLSPESPLICSMKPGDFTRGGHFIVLTGIDDEGLITVNDPNSPNNSAKHWDVNVLVSQIKGIWKYTYDGN